MNNKNNKNKMHKWIILWRNLKIRKKTRVKIKK